MRLAPDNCRSGASRYLVYNFTRPTSRRACLKGLPVCGRVLLRAGEGACATTSTGTNIRPLCCQTGTIRRPDGAGWDCSGGRRHPCGRQNQRGNQRRNWSDESQTASAKMLPKGRKTASSMSKQRSSSICLAKSIALAFKTFIAWPRCPSFCSSMIRWLKSFGSFCSCWISC
jgi:hypothetical protein